MKYENRLFIERSLLDVPDNHMSIVQHTSSGAVSPTGPLQIQMNGKGRVNVYTAFPGVEIAYITFLAPEAAFYRTTAPSGLELFYCRLGRVSWNLQDDTAVYLGAGDVLVYNTACCAKADITLPLGYVEGISVSIDFGKLTDHCPKALQQPPMDFTKIQEGFCGSSPVILPACAEIDRIFSPLYDAVPALQVPYLQLKAQEVLLFLNQLPQNHQETPRTKYSSQQADLIKEIHALLTEHLDRRFTIEELSRRYAINTSSLKAVFKTVYGLPIATYMKEYRVRRAMQLLRETRLTIAQIAEQVGYESQGKFANAFRDVAQILPTEYRRNPSMSDKTQ